MDHKIWLFEEQKTLFTVNNGNFLKFVEYLSFFDPVINENLRRVREKETHVHYLGKNMQNEMISLLHLAVQKKILASVHFAKYYSIILDCTPDISHVEQMTVIVRFVDTSDKCKVREHFLGFLPLTKTTGASMTEEVLSKLKDLGHPVENLCGQGYDNGSNMKGKNNGVQRKILDINPRAFFVPCSNHSLNLVVNDEAKCCLEAVNFFSSVQSIYVFFSASTQRWAVLLRHVTNFTLKPLSDTRWESRIDALKPLRFQISNVHDALMDIVDNDTLTGASGNLIRVEARGLVQKITNFEFVGSLVIWYKILFEINITSKLLQSKDFDRHAASKKVQITRSFLVDCRSDSGFNEMLKEAEELAKELEISTQFQSMRNPTRLRKKKNNFRMKQKMSPLWMAGKSLK